MLLHRNPTCRRRRCRHRRRLVFVPSRCIIRYYAPQAAHNSERAAAEAQAQMDALREETVRLAAAAEEKMGALSAAGEATSAAERELAQAKQDLAGQLAAAQELASNQVETFRAELSEAKAAREAADGAAIETAAELARLKSQVEVLGAEVAGAREKLEKEHRLADEGLAEARAQVRVELLTDVGTAAAVAAAAALFALFAV